MLTVTCLSREIMERTLLAGESQEGMRGGAPQPAALINAESVLWEMHDPQLRLLPQKIHHRFSPVFTPICPDL